MTDTKLYPNLIISCLSSQVNKNGSLSNVGVKDRQIFVYPFSLF